MSQGVGNIRKALPRPDHARDHETRQNACNHHASPDADGVRDVAAADVAPRHDVLGPGEGKQHEDGGWQHLHAQQPALQVGAVLRCNRRHTSGAQWDHSPALRHLLTARLKLKQAACPDGPTRVDGTRPRGDGDEQALPVAEEDDGLDQRKLEEGLEGRQQLVGAQVEEEQAVEGHGVGEVVDDGDPQVPG